MLGFVGCCAIAGVSAIVMAVDNANRPNKLLLIMLMSLRSCVPKHVYTVRRDDVRVFHGHLARATQVGAPEREIVREVIVFRQERGMHSRQSQAQGLAGDRRW
jgi:hypothetical protein